MSEQKKQGKRINEFKCMKHRSEEQQTKPKDEGKKRESRRGADEN